ncbi:Liprin-beta-2, putative [Pediculus humanus corporis]|uniref:Liprin-beta-2, putative n=1 Tax=Pediculus humanus subsp. corporis TaxID=121224 RepID=E0VG05_PEDHC|nr:Liprin-beta-2, putative [Pediculus humanus corporis]EEB12311.1 Liprin-beta-2, putative [Pediculus humanus corporis]
MAFFKIFTLWKSNRFIEGLLTTLKYKRMILGFEESEKITRGDSSTTTTTTSTIFKNQSSPIGLNFQDGTKNFNFYGEIVNQYESLMKRFLAKFRRMVEENKQLVSRIDDEIQNAHAQVNNLRDDLLDTNKRLDEHINNSKLDREIILNNVLNDKNAPSTEKNNENQQENVKIQTSETTTNNTNPFCDNFQSVNDNENKINFFGDKKTINFFNSKLCESNNFFSNSFSDSITKRNNPCSTTTNATNNTNNSSFTKKENSEEFESDKKNNVFVDCTASKIFKTNDSNNKPDIKPEDFVVTSNLKLNFLTKSPDNSISKKYGEKNTGAVPKKTKSFLSDDTKFKINGMISRNSTRDGVVGGKTNPKEVTVEDFVRPMSPLPANQADENVKISHQKSTSWEGSQNTTTLSKLKLENEKLHREIECLKNQLGKKKKSIGKNSSSSDTTDSPTREEEEDDDDDDENVSNSRSRIKQLEEELLQAKEAMNALKLDRKRLKQEKYDLLNQMKQLYGTLEDKEKELRDFIRNYEQRIRESESSLQQLSTEREEREREKWSLLRHARDEAERSLSLAAQLAAKDAHIQQLQENLDEARRHGTGPSLSDQESLASMSVSRINGSTGGMTPTSTPQVPLGLGLLPGDRGSCSADSGVRGSSDRESGGATSGGGTPTLTQEQNQLSSRLDMDSVSITSSANPSHLYQTVSTPKDCSPSLSPLNATTFSRSIDNNVLSRSVEQLSSPLEEPKRKTHHSRLTGRGGAWGSISRVFTRNRHRKVSSPSSQEDSAENYRSWSPLTEEGYAEKLRLLREAATIPMERWRAPAVLAWLEIALGMPQYGPRCAENIKSGKVLLELSDLELECGLGVTHPMHRKKLRLAIEEHRHPALVRYPCIAQLGHTWVSNEWLPDLGLGQYTENFATNMVDARMLDHLSKKELEKFLGVTRKFHQASIVHGIHLLRMMKYDRQALAVRRHQCESVDADPLVWTNQRFIKWARNIDLCEYSDNLKDSGVHGALVVLEPSFNGDTMATALGIPPSKNIIRRHLSAELEALILPAR